MSLASSTRDTAFYRAQPDPVETLDDFYTHVASQRFFWKPIRLAWSCGRTGGGRAASSGQPSRRKPGVGARTWLRAGNAGRDCRPTDCISPSSPRSPARVTCTGLMRGASYYGVSGSDSCQRRRTRWSNSPPVRTCSSTHRTPVVCVTSRSSCAVIPCCVFHGDRRRARARGDGARRPFR